MAEKPAQLRIPPRGTRGATVPLLLMRLFMPMMDGMVERYKRSSGPHQFQGFPTVLLTTVGAKTGKERTHVLGGFADGDDSWLIVASNSGGAAHPAWFINMAKNPDKVWIQVDDRKLHASVEELEGAERDKAYARVVAVAPRYGGYMKKTDREIPVLRLTPAE